MLRDLLDVLSPAPIRPIFGTFWTAVIVACVVLYFLAMAGSVVAPLLPDGQPPEAGQPIGKILPTEESR